MRSGESSCSPGTGCEQAIDAARTTRDHGSDEPRRDVVPLGDDHLHADEGEDDGQALLQVAEAAVEVGEQEVQRPQAEDGEGVRREHDELLVADGQHRRHAVDGEDHVGELDEHEHGEQRRGQPPAVDLREQVRPVELSVLGTTRLTSCRNLLLPGSTCSSSPRRAARPR